MASNNKRIIVIGIDNSEFAEKSFDWYADNIRKPDDEVILVHCPETYDFTMASPGVVKQLLEELEKAVKTIEDKYRAKAKGKNIDGKFRTGQGKPGELLIHIAKEENATMIITGSRGLGKIRRTILGSVSDYVIHHSHVPVLVCKG
ncbi:universal stress protein Slr1101-like [Mytilus californianus]|uniref:universal stress protein Slr1101-like n=1 Tax=Mytilus californianus TaxID=6549 RepID=UPI002245FB50|nr:universal stress protein Slr1101-like [Mytilus californianus]